MYGITDISGKKDMLWNQLGVKETEAKQIFGEVARMEINHGNCIQLTYYYQ